MFNYLLFKADVTDELLRLQPIFKEKLDEELIRFKSDLNRAVLDYGTHGPMEKDISAEEASNRVLLFTVN